MSLCFIIYVLQHPQEECCIFKKYEANYSKCTFRNVSSIVDGDLWSHSGVDIYVSGNLSDEDEIVDCWRSFCYDGNSACSVYMDNV